MTHLTKAAQAAAARRVPTRHSLYAYAHVRTNQVLYSLNRTLHPRAPEQLPPVGPNTVPPSLRKDAWRPLYTLVLPSQGSAQILDAYKKLQEWKRLHEYNWKPTEEMKRNYTEEEIEEMQNTLDKRGGNKKESVYDIIKRKKKKMRQEIVMNQKANSVADLAAVLLAQEGKGEELRMEQRRGKYLDRLGELHRTILLAKQAERGELENLEQMIEKQKRVLARTAKEETDVKAKYEAKGKQVPRSQNKYHVRALLSDLERRQFNMQFAAKAMANMEDGQESPRATSKDLVENYRLEARRLARHAENLQAKKMNQRAHVLLQDTDRARKELEAMIAEMQEARNLVRESGIEIELEEGETREPSNNVIAEEEGEAAEPLTAEEAVDSLQAHLENLRDELQFVTEGFSKHLHPRSSRQKLKKRAAQSNIDVKRASRKDVEVLERKVDALTQVLKAEGVLDAAANEEVQEGEQVVSSEEQQLQQGADLVFQDFAVLIEQNRAWFEERARSLEEEFRPDSPKAALMEKLEKQSMGSYNSQAVEAELKKLRSEQSIYETYAEAVKLLNKSAVQAEEEAQSEEEGEGDRGARERMKRVNSALERINAMTRPETKVNSIHDVENLFKAFSAAKNEETFFQLHHPHLPYTPHFPKDPHALPKSQGERRNKLLRQRTPAYHLRDARVEWANVLDAEFAAVWPQAVAHEWMGFIRHKAKPPGAKTWTRMGAREEEDEEEEVAEREGAEQKEGVEQEKRVEQEEPAEQEWVDEDEGPNPQRIEMLRQAKQKVLERVRRQSRREVQVKVEKGLKKDKRGRAGVVRKSKNGAPKRKSVDDVPPVGEGAKEFVSESPA